MTDSALSDSYGPPGPGRKLSTQLKWLTFFRVGLITILLAATVFVNLQDESDLSDRLYVYVYYLCTITYIVSFAYTLSMRFLQTERQHLLLTYFQFTGDVLLASALVLVTGGTDSVFTFFFSLVIIGGAIVLFRPGALYLATVSTALLVLIGLVELYEVGNQGLLQQYRLDFLSYPEGMDQEERVRRFTYNVAVNATAFFGVGLLASWLSEQLRRSAREVYSQQAEIEQLKVLYEHIVDSVPSGLITFDTDHRITFANRASLALLELSEDQLVGNPVTEHFRDLRFVLDNPSKEDALNREETVLVKNRRRVYLGWTLSPLRDAEGLLLGHTFMFQDITRVRELEHSMRRSEKMAAVGELSAAIAHEIRNPLAAISGSVQMLSMGPNASDSQRRLMNIVQRETDQLNTWITDFLNYSRPAPLRMEVLDLDQLVRDTLVVFGQNEQLASKDIELEFVGTGSVHILADPARMRQVLWNLLTNAAQSMDGGKIRVDTEASLATSRPMVELRIIDEGVGISAEDVERIFHPFFTTKERGTGLGLAVIHRIIENHDGRITVDSVLGQGTTFQITLPITAPVSDGLRRDSPVAG